MKKISILLLLLVLMTGCEAIDYFRGIDYERSQLTDDQIISDELAVLLVLKAENGQIDYALYNDSHQLLYYNYPFQLEIYLYETWYVVVMEPNMVFSSTFMSLQPLDGFRESIMIEDFYKDLVSGRYRLVKEVKDAQQQPFYVVSSFDLEVSTKE